MFDWREPGEWRQLFRYYQAGIVNTAFGYGAFALLVWLGLNIYVAQILAHIAGTAFNYFTYSRYVFADGSRARGRFILSYAVNYLLSVAALFGFEQVVTSPYLSGFLAVVLVSAINFLILKRFVFRTEGAA